MSQGGSNCFWILLTSSSQVPAKSKFFKNGCVTGAQMLARSDMIKQPRDSYGGEAKFTPVQELKQVGGRNNNVFLLESKQAPSTLILFWKGQTVWVFLLDLIWHSTVTIKSEIDRSIFWGMVFMGKPAVSKHPPPPPRKPTKSLSACWRLELRGECHWWSHPEWSFCGPVILDMMGYDACPALHTLNKVAAGEVLNSSLEVYRRNLFFHKK